jgi:hypothetical protein
LTPKQVSKLVYGDNPFAESSLGIAHYIQANSTPEDRIAILGSEPQIFFYAKRQSASRQIFVYSMTDATPFAVPLQQEMLRELEATRPKFIVVSMQSTSWNIAPEYVMEYLQPFMPLVQNNYSLVGVVDILPEGVNYQWLTVGENAEPMTNYPLYVMQRNS